MKFNNFIDTSLSHWHRYTIHVKTNAIGLPLGVCVLLDVVPTINIYLPDVYVLELRVPVLFSTATHTW